MTQDEDDFGSISVYPRDISAHDFSKGGYKSENVTDSNKGFNVVSRWYGYGGYYLVRYYGADGHKLKRPEVTYFTVKYVAANLLAGNMAIDITEYNEGVGTPAFSDVLSEALLQNPLILASIYSSRTYTSSAGTPLPALRWATCPIPLPTERKELDKMCRDAASEVVKDDMTPEQKAEAIDAWVCSHLKYKSRYDSRVPFASGGLSRTG